MDTLVTLSLTINETLKWLSTLPVLMQESFKWRQCSDRYTISLYLSHHYLSEDSRNKIGTSVQNKGGGIATFLKTAEIRLARMCRTREVEDSRNKIGVNVQNKGGGRQQK